MGRLCASGIALCLLAGCGSLAGFHDDETGGGDAGPGGERFAPGEWVLHFGADRIFGSAGKAVVVSPGGPIVVAGNFFGSFSLGGEPLPEESGPFVAAYDRDGRHLWSHAYVASGISATSAAALVSEDRVWVGGGFGGTLELGTQSFTAGALYDVFLAEFSSDGTELSARAYGGDGRDDLADIAAADGGGFSAVGSYNDDASFGGGELPHVLNGDLFATHVGSDGAHAWSAGFGGSGSDGAEAAAMDARGLFVVGGFDDAGGVSLDFGGGELVSAGDTDGFAALIEDGGTHGWSMRFGGAGADAGEAIALTGDGGVVMAGTFTGPAELAGESLGAAGETGLVVVRLDGADGSVVWSQHFTGDVHEVVGLVPTSAGLVVAVNFGGELDLGGRTLTAPLRDFALVRLTAKGDITGVHHASGHTEAEGLAVDGNHLVVTGSFADTTDFGGGPVATTGNRDIFLLRLAQDRL